MSAANELAEYHRGRLPENIVHFVRALRKAGVKVGPSSVIAAIEAVKVGGMSDRDDFYWTLHCVLINRREDSILFAEAFRLFWRSRELVEKMLQMFSQQVRDDSERAPPPPGSNRVSQALFAEDALHHRHHQERPEIEIDASFTTSDREILRSKDFAQMSALEIAEARAEIARMWTRLDEVKTRRFLGAQRQGRADARATFAKAMRTGGDLLVPQFKTRKKRVPPMVVLADISGSMSQYSRMFMHFFHALCETDMRVYTFLFGTRLTNVTRQLQRKDPDVALADVSNAVEDWSGGTRIGETLYQFNRVWGRRVLGQGANVLLVTDGLERDDGVLLEREMDRLHRSCRKLIWLNPLLRFDGFEPKARGVRIMLDHVDAFRPVHSLDALGDLCEALARDSFTARSSHPKSSLKAALVADDGARI